MLWKKEEQAPIIGSICHWKWKSANANGPSSPYLIVHVCHLWTLVGFIFSSIDGSLVTKYVNLLEVWVIASDIIWSKVKYSRQNLCTQSRLLHTVCAIDSTSTSPTGSHTHFPNTILPNNSFPQPLVKPRRIVTLFLFWKQTLLMNEIFCNKYYEEILRYFVLYKNPTISNTEHTNSLKLSVWSTICKRNIVSAKDPDKTFWDSVLVCGKMGKTDVGRIIIFVGSSRRQQEIWSSCRSILRVKPFLLVYCIIHKMS